MKCDKCHYRGKCREEAAGRRLAGNGDPAMLEERVFWKTPYPDGTIVLERVMCCFLAECEVIPPKAHKPTKPKPTKLTVPQLQQILRPYLWFFDHHDAVDKTAGVAHRCYSWSGESSPVFDLEHVVNSPWGRVHFGRCPKCEAVIYHVESEEGP